MCSRDDIVQCLRQQQIQLVAEAGAALLVLLVIQVLNVYKPRGMTAYGRRKQHEQRTGPQRSKQERAVS